MIQNNGTPVDLIAAVRNGLRQAYGAMATIDDAEILRQHVRDYLAQQFTVAIGRAKTKEEELSLMALFERITK